jgi:uncharacterized protein (TIRG00374 family)
MKSPKVKPSMAPLMESVKISKILIPIVLGLGVVIWLMSRQLNLEALSELRWTSHSLFWILMAFLLYIIRHFFYAWRLQVMTGHIFSLRKCMQLIAIWEFSSAVSPTNVGGAGVAILLLSQERLSGAKTVAVVIYSLVIDTILFVVLLPLFLLLMGPIIIRAGMDTMSLDGYGLTFVLVLAAMATYGALFFYGLFINPRTIKRILIFLSRWRILTRFRTNLRQTALDVVVAANEIKQQKFDFHLKSMTGTIGAWTTRFLAVNCIIMVLVPNVPMVLWDQMVMFARGWSMFAITSFSPTPGASGLAEFLFGGFYGDYIPEGTSSLIALVWRLITYYPYLILGAIIIPIWIRGIMSRRKHSET